MFVYTEIIPHPNGIVPKRNHESVVGVWEGLNAVKNGVQARADVLVQETQNAIAFLLQKKILPSRAAVMLGVSERGESVQPNHETIPFGEEIRLKKRIRPARNRKSHAHAKAPPCFSQGLKPRKNEFAHGVLRAEATDYALAQFKLKRGMNEKIRQRLIYAVTTQPAKARRERLLPMRHDRKFHIRRPAFRRAERHHDAIADRLVARRAPFIHLRANGDIQVDIIVNSGFFFAVMRAVQPSDELRQTPFPRNRQRQKKRVKPRVVKAFAEKGARRQYDARFVVGNRRKSFPRRLKLPSSHAAQQQDDGRIPSRADRRHPCGKATE